MAIDTDLEKLAVMEMGEYWEPGIPFSPGTLGTDDQQVLLWGFPEVLWLGEAVDNALLALMEMGDYWEPGLPVSPGVLGDNDKQQLLWGYPDIHWGSTGGTSSTHTDVFARGFARGFSRGLR